MRFRQALFLGAALSLAVPTFAASGTPDALPSPKAFLGHEPGED